MKTIAFSIATDQKNLEYYEMMKNSWKKFHPDIELIVWDAKKVAKYDDPHWLYRATPNIMYELRNDYDLIIQTNADQIITGSLDYVLKGDYDMGVVYNYNRVDTATYGPISVLDIPNHYYYNLGFIAVRSKRLIEHWHKLVNSYHFFNYQYREQDLMNILAWYGDYKVKCFDEYDPKTKYSAWHGLRVKGEFHKCIMRNGEMILPRSDEGYPERDKKIKMLHYAGGNNGIKMNYKISFNQECITYLDWLTSDNKLSYKDYVEKHTQETKV